METFFCNLKHTHTHYCGDPSNNPLPTHVPGMFYSSKHVLLAVCTLHKQFEITFWAIRMSNVENIHIIMEIIISLVWKATRTMTKKLQHFAYKQA